MIYSIIYRKNCPYSEKAITLIKENLKKNDSVDFYLEGKDFSNNDFKEEFGITATYPRVYFNAKFVGGYDDIKNKF